MFELADREHLSRTHFESDGDEDDGRVGEVCDSIGDLEPEVSGRQDLQDFS